LGGAQHRHGVVAIGAEFLDAGRAGRAQVDDLCRAVRCDQDVVRPQILMHDLQPVKRLQAACDLLDDGDCRFQRRTRIGRHPLRQRAPFDVFAHGVERAALPRARPGAHDVAAVDAARQPFLGQKAFQIGGVVPQVQGWNLDDDGVAAVEVFGQVDVAAAAGAQLVRDAKAFERLTHVQQRRTGQAAGILRHLSGLARGQGVDAHDLHGQVVVAAAGKRQRDQCARGGVQIAGVGGHGLAQIVVADMLVHAIGRQQEHVAGFHGLGVIVDFQMRRQAQRAAQVTFVVRDPDAVILGQLLDRAIPQAIDARVADMQDVRGGALEHHHGQRADVAAVLVLPMALAALRMQPGVGRAEHLLGRLLHGPGLGRAVIVFQKAGHRRLAGDVTDVAAADAVGQRDGDALGAQQRLARHAQPVEILVDGLDAGIGVLAHRHFQRSGGRGGRVAVHAEAIS